MLTPKMQDALNGQINAEMWSAHFYISMAMHFEAEGRDGIANWFKVQYQEELAHCEILRNWINERGGRVLIAAVDAVPTTWKSELDAFECTLRHEEKVSAQFNELYALAEAEKDYATRGRLDWFISEQSEEEYTVRTLIDQLKLIGDNGLALYTFDRQLAGRTYTTPEPLNK